MFHPCSTVKEYEKKKINDLKMKLTVKIAERYETRSKHIVKLRLEPMAESQVVAVVVISVKIQFTFKNQISKNENKNYHFFLVSGICTCTDKEPEFKKKRVLENIEVDFSKLLMIRMEQDQLYLDGLGSEKLSDVASNIIVAMPLNDDDVLTVDLGISATLLHRLAI
jgi:hypothetical protein